MAAEENRFAVQERILRNKTWQDFSEIWWLFLIKQLFHSGLLDIYIYYTTQAVRGPITKINQSKCSIAGPIFSKYWTGHCPE